MSDHDTWNMFAAASYAAWLAGGDYAAEECRTRAVADADWFVIESKKRAPAIVAPPGMSSDPNAVFTNTAPFRGEPTPPQPDDDGWIKWEGGECPVADNVIVRFRRRDGSAVSGAFASNFNWRRYSSDQPTDIVAYRIVSEAGVTK